MKPAALVLALAIASLPQGALAAPSAPAEAPPARAGAPRPAAPASTARPAASAAPAEAEGPGTWDGGVALPLAMTSLGLLSGGAMLWAFGPGGMSSRSQPQLPALAAGGALVLGTTLMPFLLRPKGSEAVAVGPVLATGAASTALLLAPGLVELAGNNGLLEGAAILGTPLLFGTALGWSLGDLAADAPARRGGPYPEPWSTHVLSTGTSLATAALGVSLAANAPQPLQFAGPFLVLAAPAVGLGVGHGSLGDAPRGVWIGASLLGPLAVGAALPLLGSAGLTGSPTGGSGRYLGAVVAVVGAAAGLAGGIGATAVDLEHRAGVRLKK